MNAIQPTILQLPLNVITLDADLQPRAKIDDATQQDYMSHIAEGGTLPPVLVIYDGDKHYLVDGYHRWHAHKALGLVEIAAEVRPGNALDAVMASLQANAEHGKRRVEADFRRGYQIAVNYKLVQPTDSERVAAILRCTERWARDLTSDARERERILRDEAIVKGRQEGRSLRDVAASVGVDPVTVRNVEKRKASENQHPFEADPDDPRQMNMLAEPTPGEVAKANLSQLERPEVKTWHRTLEALRGITAQPSPAALFRSRYAGFDHAIGEELRQARTWMNDMHRRFFDV